MEVKRLKMENNTVLVSDCHDGKWTTADKTHISSLQRVLGRLESHSFASRSIKEDMVFNKEFKVGTGSVKSFKDEDGDFICTYEDKAGETAVQIDEDLEFEKPEHVPKPRAVEPVNLWGGKAEAEPKRARPSNFTVPKLPLIKHAVPNYKFQKRQPGKREHKWPLPRPGVRPEMISYAKKEKWNKTRRMDGDLMKAVLHYNRTHGIRDGIEMEFYLKIEKSAGIADEEFERLLRTVMDL